MAEYTPAQRQALAMARARAAQRARMAQQPAPEAPDALTQFGRSAASLADVAIGAVPGVAQAVAYPFMRAGGMSPQEATAASQGILPSLQQPVGRAFGVTETPEYQQEPTRQLMEFIGTNISKGTKWLSEQTGLPESDVANMAGTLTLAAPQVAGAARRAVTPAMQDLAAITKGPGIERRSMASYARGPQLDAAKEAQRLGIALHPSEVAPGGGARIAATVAGPKTAQKIVEANRPRVTQIARDELGLAPEQSLAGKEAFDMAREQLAGPYNEIRAIPNIKIDDATVARLDDLKLSKNSIDVQDKKTVKKVNAALDSAQQILRDGVSGAQLLDDISNLRKKAKRTYDSQSADADAFVLADTRLALANRLEAMIDNSVADPQLLARYRDARQKMARTYAYEAATDFNTGMVDVGKLARVTAKDNALTGDIASLGQIAGNYPSAFKSTPATWLDKAITLGARSSPAGAVGAALGAQMGGDITSAIIGGGIGGTVGALGGALYARRLASPGYQAGMRIPDYRVPRLNAMVEEAAPAAVQNQLALGYDPRLNEITPVTRVRGPNEPNFVMRDGAQPVTQAVWDPVTKTFRTQTSAAQPQVTPAMPEQINALPAPNAQATINALRAEDARRAAMSRTLGQQAEAQAAAAEAPAQRFASKETTRAKGAARSGVVLERDPTTGGLREVQPTPAGATLQPTALESAVQKMTGAFAPTGKESFARLFRTGVEGENVPRTGGTTTKMAPRRFALTAEERIAWEKTKVNLGEIVPGMRALTDEAIAARMGDRAWVEQTVAAARAKAEGLARQEALVADALANRANLAAMGRERTAELARLEKIRADRQNMLDLAEELEMQLSRPRATSKGRGQGPKTLAAKRNQLMGDTEVLNNLRGE